MRATVFSRWVLIGVVLIVAVLPVVPAPSHEPQPRMVFPGKRWDIVAPAAEGLDAGKLAKAVDYLKANSGKDGVRELVVVRRGRIVWHGDNIDNVHASGRAPSPSPAPCSAS